MAKKRGKAKRMRVCHPDAAGIDIGSDDEILVRLPLRIVQVTQDANGKPQVA